jgi:CRP-like cAMP-binding protein
MGGTHLQIPELRLIRALPRRPFHDAEKAIRALPRDLVSVVSQHQRDNLQSKCQKLGKPGEAETLLPKITQETLAEMIGSTRSRVSFFMNRFRSLGFIEYNGGIKVHKSLLNVILHD